MAIGSQRAITEMLRRLEIKRVDKKTRQLLECAWAAGRAHGMEGLEKVVNESSKKRRKKG